MVAAVSDNEVVPGAALVPPQELARLFGAAITRPEGSDSVNATPFNATTFPAGLTRVTVKVAVPCSAISGLPNTRRWWAGPQSRGPRNLYLRRSGPVDPILNRTTR